MTLIVAIKTDATVVLVADGMGYIQGSGHEPYPTQKLHAANGCWVIGICGWAGLETYHKQLEAEIANSSARFDVNLSIGGPEYVKALCQKTSGSFAPGDSKIILAGMGSSDPTVTIAELVGNDKNELIPSFHESPPIAAYGSQSTTATALIKMFSECCQTPQHFKELACFAVWRVAQQELTVGQLERYHFNACIVGPEGNPEIERLNSKPTLQRMESLLKSLQQAASQSFR